MNRLHNLDYLRGIAALGIMIYHYLTWAFGEFSADAFMGRVGVYGVSIFYVLSGLTLYYVYYDKMQPSKEELVSFFKKRIWRIFPLLWLATIAAIVLSKKAPDVVQLLLNLSGLFGFVQWDKYFSTGVWSIGNELVFYVFFPFFILFTKRIKALMVVLSLGILGLYLYFAFVGLSPQGLLHQQWRTYTNPLNQVFLFLGGYLIGLFFHKAQIKDWAVVLLLCIGFGLFCFYPAEGNTISIVVGIPRMVFTLCCLLICIAFYKMTFQFPRFVHSPLTLLGEASYSVYLLHPIIWALMGIVVKITTNAGYAFPPLARLSLSIVLTLVISHFVYNYFEKYFMKFGRTIKKSR